MAYETIRFKREELYEQVWSRPMIELARQHGLSDVGLAKICRKLKIPLPGRGYWVRQKFGRVQPRPPLPPLRGNEPSEVVVTKHEQPTVEPQALSETERLIALEHLPENLIQVEPTLVSPHPHVARTRKCLRVTNETGSELDRWLVWAVQQADRIDPLCVTGE